MENLKPLSDFFLAIENDFRISTTHIAMYMALLHYRADKGFINPIQVFRRDLTPIAKISSLYTYHKCIQELSDYGYIKYEPSFKKTQGSKVYFVD
ncbi:hypothetical protein C8C83_4520 [Flavobacterium sp. 90]|uniref:hypothetical protein n=1 Tax=unclassified Flavobacterium TaxID=196869 RepID=UPI000EAEE548|nr:MULTISPECIES: hypothetical protein [unclassified Flavobacterium]RKR05188.1 hypothetical protein C8C82_4862 [Flavobacterium sp. 81]TCK56503.1 hypothetical protein C8C83_4520 [Flavobacterium sp. 90]